MAAADAMVARQRFRAGARRVLQHPADLPAHLARLDAALGLPGSEPVQGALADLFMGCRSATATERQAALRAVRGRLSPWVARLFGEFTARTPFPLCSRMATRWSVLATASLDMPRRAMRCSSDDAQGLATAAADAWRIGDEPAQQAFLTHCLVCGDTLAFALARRALLREAAGLPPGWSGAYLQLQEWMLAA